MYVGYKLGWEKRGTFDKGCLEQRDPMTHFLDPMYLQEGSKEALSKNSGQTRPNDRFSGLKNLQEGMRLAPHSDAAGRMA